MGGGGAASIAIVGHYAFIGSNYILEILDVSNPTSPSFLTDTVLPGPVPGIHVVNGLAYAANIHGGLRIMDVTNPMSPTTRGSYDPPGGYALGVFVSGGLAFVVGSRWTGTRSVGNLRIVNVANPSSPTLRGSYDTPGYPWEVFVSGGMAYVADDSSLQIIDVRNPSAPVFRSSYDSRGGKLRNVFVSNGTACVTITFGPRSPVGTLELIDVTNPGAPKRTGYYATPGSGGGVFVSGRLAFVILGGGLRVVDISNPALPALRGFYGYSPLPAPLGAGVGDVVVCGDLVYCSDQNSQLNILQFTGRPARAAGRWRMYR